MSGAAGDFWARYGVVVSRLLPPLGPGQGVPEEALSAAERRLDLRLPLTLRQFYARAGGRDDINRAHNRLLRPNELVAQDGALVFYEENQAVVLWGIRLDALGEDDPPVVSANNVKALTWGEERERLSAFLLDMLLWQATCGETLYGGYGRADAGAIARAGDEWERIGLGPNAGREALLRDGQLLYVVSRDLADAWPEVLGSGRTVEDLRALTKTFVVIWDYSALDEQEAQSHQ